MSGNKPDNSILFGLAPDGVYQADRVTPIAGALLPHRFTLTTRPTDLPKAEPPEPFGGLLSAALSLASRPVDVIDHPVLRSPDFPPVTTLDNQRPSHPLTAGVRMIDPANVDKVHLDCLCPEILCTRRLVQSGSIWIMSIPPCFAGM